MPQIKVVTEYSQVEMLTLQGWEVQEIRDVDNSVTTNVQVDRPPPYQGAMPTSTWENRTIALRAIVFIMRLNDDSALAKLNAELANARDTARGLAEVVKQTQKELDAGQRQDAETQRALKKARDELISMASARVAQNAAVDRYERSISAIRKEIGDGRMREILDAAGLVEKKAP
jgi:hypothetical protein